VFSPFAQDDFLLTTNHRSHLLGGSYVVGRGTVLNLWALVSRPDPRGPLTPDDDDRWRLRLDLDLRC